MNANFSWLRHIPTHDDTMSHPIRAVQVTMYDSVCLHCMQEFRSLRNSRI